MILKIIGFSPGHSLQILHLHLTFIHWCRLLGLVFCLEALLNYFIDLNKSKPSTIWFKMFEIEIVWKVLLTACWYPQKPRLKLIVFNSIIIPACYILCMPGQTWDLGPGQQVQDDISSILICILSLSTSSNTSFTVWMLGAAMNTRFVSVCSRVRAHWL